MRARTVCGRTPSFKLVSSALDFTRPAWLRRLGSLKSCQKGPLSPLAAQTSTLWAWGPSSLAWRFGSFFFKCVIPPGYFDWGSGAATTGAAGTSPWSSQISGLCLGFSRQEILRESWWRCLMSWGREIWIVSTLGPFEYQIRSYAYYPYCSCIADCLHIACILWT